MSIVNRQINHKALRLAIASSPMLTRDMLPVGFLPTIDGIARGMSIHNQPIETTIQRRINETIFYYQNGRNFQ